MQTMSVLSRAVLQQRIPGEPRVDLTARGFTIRSQRVTPAHLCQDGVNANGDINFTHIFILSFFIIKHF